MSDATPTVGPRRARDGRWPAIPLDAWEGTRATFHLWTQVVGKVRMVNEPLVNHWWEVPLYATSRGFGTSLIAHPTGPAFEIGFDLVDHQLAVTTVDGTAATLALEPRSVDAFYTAVMAMLDDLGVGTEVWPVPVEIPGAVPFVGDEVHADYEPDAVHRFWLATVEMTRVFTVFRARFVGKASPVHLFWGGLDLAASRFSGRPAPPHPGGAPNCGPHVMHEAYSHEVSSAGYWPGGPGAEGCFYSYVYPEPDGFREADVPVEGATYDAALGEFVLPYEVVRTAPDPDAVLLTFLQSTYEAAADAAGWDRPALER